MNEAAIAHALGQIIFIMMLVLGYHFLGISEPFTSIVISCLIFIIYNQSKIITHQLNSDK